MIQTPTDRGIVLLRVSAIGDYSAQQAALEASSCSPVQEEMRRRKCSGNKRFECVILTLSKILGNIMNKLSLTLMLTLTATALFVPVLSAADFDAVKTKLDAAMKAEVRTEADTDRDRNRKPVETLEFFGLRDNMKVVELLPGGGWYTKLLAPVLAEKGEFYIAYGTSRVVEQMQGKAGFEKLRVAGEEAKLGRPEGAKLTLPAIPIWV